MNKIIQKANEIYKKYGCGDLDFTVAELRAEVFETPLFNENQIKEVYFPDLKTIAIASNLHPYQKRYLIAHGLGHHLFHQHNSKGYIRLHEKGVFGCKEMGRIEISRKEGEADIFASYLLISEEKLNPILDEEWLKESLNPISELAEEFQVPEELIRKRLEFGKGI